MYEDPNCVDCALHRGCKTRCLPSRGGLDCKLAIFLDYPSVVEDRRGKSFVGDNARFVDYCLRRMSIDPTSVYLDYILKCYPNKIPGKKDERMGLVRSCSQYRFGTLEDMPNLRSLVGLGGLCCETFTGEKTIGSKQGAEWRPLSPLMQRHVSHIWIGYSSGIIREKPSEAGAIYRVIWAAAQEAGLNPVANMKVKPYEFDV